MKTSALRLILGAALLTGLPAAQLSATVIFTDFFDYPDGAIGGSGGWYEAPVSGPAANMSLSGGAILYAHDTDATSIRTVFKHELGTTISNETVYYGLTFDATVAPNTAGGQRIVAFSNSNTDSSIDSFRSALWLGEGTAEDTFRLGITMSSASSSGIAWLPGDYAINTPVRVLVRYDELNGESTLWVDPVEESSMGISDSAGSPASRTTIAFYNRTNVNIGTFTIDDLVVATTFSDALVAIPEPSVYAMLGLGGLALLMLRRRR